jgi:hypothetical protein
VNGDDLQSDEVGSVNCSLLAQIDSVSRCISSMSRKFYTQLKDMKV